MPIVKKGSYPGTRVPGYAAPHRSESCAPISSPRTLPLSPNPPPLNISQPRSAPPFIPCWLTSSLVFIGTDGQSSLANFRNS
eukprot:3701997-Rhodomonas_salina.2